MKRSNPLLSILIVNWNTRESLADCLASLAESADGLRFQTIVVDNGSTDASVATIQADYPWIRLIENSENCGFARANNQALVQSEGEFALLLNSDTIVHEGALARLIATDAMLWILDEPFTSLDKASMALFSGLFEQHLQQRGVIVMTSHHDISLPSQALQRLQMGKTS